MRERRPIVLATANPGKVREITAALTRAGFAAVSCHEVAPGLTWVETGSSFEDNARLKAQAVWGVTHCTSLADDSGIEVESLGGAPGPYSSRYAGPGATDAQNNAALLRALGTVHERRARYVCVLVLVTGTGREFLVRGTCEGTIGFAPRGSRGFGYDPLFVLPDGRTMAEVPLEEKNTVSHRGRALADLVRHLATVPPAELE